MKHIFSALLTIYSSILIAQKNDEKPIIVDTGKKDSIDIFRPSIYDYQYFTEFSQKKIFDTIFTINNYYRYTQYNNQDNFGKIAFANIGSGFQNLLYTPNTEQYLSLLPSKKSDFILGIQDIRYYDVKTPTTTFYYHNGIKNGTSLKSTYTQNIGKNLNLTAEYMGLRSMGEYQRDLADSNYTLFSAHYLSENKKYETYAHFIYQNINNEEFGGIADLTSFTEGDSKFRNRENLTVNLRDSFSQMKIRRYYLSHSFTPFSIKNFPFKIKHSIYHQTNIYYYTEDSPENYYYSPYISHYPTNSYKFSRNLNNTVSLVWEKSSFRGETGIRHQALLFGTGFPLILNNISVDSGKKENRLGILGSLDINLWNKITLHSKVEFSNGNTFKNFMKIDNRLSLEPIKDYIIDTEINIHSLAPTFNYLVNASYYQDYNYKLDNFKNQTILEVKAKAILKFWNTEAFINYYSIGNYTYLNSDALPQQSSKISNIVQIGGEFTIPFGKLNLNTKLTFQNQLTNKKILPLPNFIGRTNIYYQSKAFKKAADIQTGFNIYYFSQFHSRTYFPLLNEFILSDSQNYTIGGQPIASIFFNLKVKKLMIYTEGVHFNTLFTKNKSYAAPYYPIVDFRLNLGLIWYLFH